jgi:hypothetical protein
MPTKGRGVAAERPPKNATAAQGEPKSVPDVAKELWQLLIDYGKQETVDPLKRLGKFVAFGVPAMLCLGIGVILLLIGGLRVLQTETGSHFTGHLSWLPYVITLAVAGLLAALAVMAIARQPKERRNRS